MKTAFFIDAAFFLKRLRSLRRENQTAESAVTSLQQLVDHQLGVHGRNTTHLYRVLVYDCPPLDRKTNYPISNKQLDFAKTASFTFRTAFQQRLHTVRKVAVRLGRLNAQYGEWKLKADALKALRNGKRVFAHMTDDDFEYDVGQKGVDMRLGLDIASIAAKGHVDQMVLVACDSDFVPAAKAARREGIDFILDPMGAPVPADLREHVDDVHSVIPQAPQQSGPPDLPPPAAPPPA